MEHETLYALCEPDGDCEVRYVGVCRVPLDVKLAFHLRCKSTSRPVCRWVQWLGKQGKRPVIKELATVIGESISAAETQMIQQWMRWTGNMLLNIDSAIPAEMRNRNRPPKSQRPKHIARRHADRCLEIITKCKG